MKETLQKASEAIQKTKELYPILKSEDQIKVDEIVSKMNYALGHFGFTKESCDEFYSEKIKNLERILRRYYGEVFVEGDF